MKLASRPLLSRCCSPITPSSASSVPKRKESLRGAALAFLGLGRAVLTVALGTASALGAFFTLWLLGGCASHAPDHRSAETQPSLPSASRAQVAGTTDNRPRPSGAAESGPAANSIERNAAGRADAATAKGAAHGRIDAETLAERRLIELVEQSEAVLAALRDAQGSISGTGLDRSLVQQVETVAQRFENHLVAFPTDLHAMILYGKWLRAIGRPERAIYFFVAANELDPTIAVVKQQIGNHLAETGEATLAAAYFVAATQLAPEVAVYHYQLGELLVTFRDRLVQEGWATLDALESTVLAAWEACVRLEPSEPLFREKLAEAYLRQQPPQFQAAAEHWKWLELAATDGLTRDWARLQRARLLSELGQVGEAAELLRLIRSPALMAARAELLVRAQAKTEL